MSAVMQPPAMPSPITRKVEIIRRETVRIMLTRGEIRTMIARTYQQQVPLGARMIAYSTEIDPGSDLDSIEVTFTTETVTTEPLEGGT